MEERKLNSFKICAFCPTEKLEPELYKCPKCQLLYCSVRCYRHKKHLECSENFYRQQCEEHVGETSTESSSTEKIKRPTTTFEQYMKQNGKDGSGEIDEEKINPKLPMEVNEDEQILFDSDDEPEYLGNIVGLTMKHFEGMDEAEVDRKLMAAGMPIGVGKDEEHLEQLYQQLNEEEKKAFTAMAEGMFQDEFQAMTNCFKPRMKKKEH